MNTLAMTTLAFYNNPTALIIVLVVVLLLFGGQKIPEMMKGLGSGMREFKKGMNEDEVLRQDNLAHNTAAPITTSAPATPEQEREIRARVEAEMRREGKL